MQQVAAREHDDLVGEIVGLDADRALEAIIDVVPSPREWAGEVVGGGGRSGGVCIHTPTTRRRIHTPTRWAGHDRGGGVARNGCEAAWTGHATLRAVASEAG